MDTFRAPKQTVPCFRVPVIHQRKEVVIPSVLQDKFQGTLYIHYFVYTTDTCIKYGMYVHIVTCMYVRICIGHKMIQQNTVNPIIFIY